MGGNELKVLGERFILVSFFGLLESVSKCSILYTVSVKYGSNSFSAKQNILRNNPETRQFLF